MNVYNLFFKKIFTAKGRSSRREYIIKFLLTTFIFVFASYVMDEIQNPNLINTIFVLSLCSLMTTILIQYFPLAIRRLHDLNASGWYVLLTFVPFGQFLILWLMFKEGTQGSNKYGEEPKYRETIQL